MSKNPEEAKSLARQLTEATGFKNVKDWTLAISGYTVALFPGKGVVAAGLATAGLREPQIMTMNIAMITAVAPFLLGSGYELIFKGDKNVKLKANGTQKRKLLDLKKLRLFSSRADEPAITACGMKMDLTDLFTNILIVGSIGSGKTSAAIFPILEQLYELFADFDNDITSKNPYKQIGGLYLDVKGEFYEGLVYVLDRAKRNFGKDLFIISPYPYIKVLKVRDVDTGNILYVSCQRSSKGGCVSKILSNPENTELEQLNSDYIDDHNDFSRVNASLKGQIFNTDGLHLRYLTWREEDGKLVRVKCQKSYGIPEYATITGERETIPIPKRVEYMDIIAQDRIHSFNIIDPRRKPIEVGKRLSVLGELAQGGGDEGKSKHRYFYDVAERALQKAIIMLRIIYPNKEVEPIQVMHMVTKEDFTSDQVKVANEKVRDLERQEKQMQDGGETMGFEYRRIQEEKSMLQEAVHYWSKTWPNENQEQKGSFVNIIENMFSIFVMDANLQKTFCKARTFSFDDCCNIGRNYVFLPGEEYEESSRLIATALKLEFQDSMLNRLKSSRMDKTRLVIFGNDEAQKNIVAGGVLGKGDEQFMSLSRAARVLNLIATQSYQSINLAIGNDKGTVYRQSFGIKIWFQNDDDFTNKEASRICGTVKKLKSSTDNDALSSTSIIDGAIGGTKSNTKSGQTKFEKKTRHDPEDFINLKALQSITFNKGEEGTHDKVVKKQNQYSEVTNPNGLIIPELMRDYFQHSTEYAILESDDYDNYNPSDKSSVEEVKETTASEKVPQDVTEIPGATVEADGTVTETDDTYSSSTRFAPLTANAPTEVTIDEIGREVIQKALDDTLSSIEHEASEPDDAGEEDADSKAIDIAAMVQSSEERAAEQVESVHSNQSTNKGSALKPADVIRANTIAKERGLGSILDDMIVDLEIERLPDVNQFINRTRSKVPDATNDSMVATRALPGPKGLVKGDIKKATDSAPRISQVDTKKVLENNKAPEVDAETQKLLDKMNQPRERKNTDEAAATATSVVQSARRYMRRKK